MLKEANVRFDQLYVSKSKRRQRNAKPSRGPSGILGQTVYYISILHRLIYYYCL